MENSKVVKKFKTFLLPQAVEEPTSGGKEKRRRKLDEIVLGLSAAKEQKTFPDPSLPSSKKQQITPSVSVTPASAPSSSSNQSNQKPFTITVTSVPGTIDVALMVETIFLIFFSPLSNRFIENQSIVQSVEQWFGCIAEYGTWRW